MIKRIFLCLSLLISRQALAKNSEMEIMVESGFEPTTAIGLVLSEKGTAQKLKTNLKKLSDDKYLVSFQTQESEWSANSYATAMLTSEEGDIAFGEVKPLSASTLHDPMVSLPKCKKQSAMLTTIQGQFALIESLSSVRAERRDVLQTQIKNELKGEFLAKLQRMEEGFGIVHAEALSPDLPPYTLLERLQALSDAIKEVKAQKERQIKLEKAAESTSSNASAENPSASPTPAASVE